MLPSFFRTVISHPRRWFADGILVRVLRNAGMLLTGRVATGVLNLAILSIAARTLGVSQFGLIILVQTFVQTVTAIATFQSWQAVIRYGALTFEHGDTPSFQRLLRFCTLLDIAGALIGMVAAIVAIPFVGPRLGWDASLMSAAKPYALVTLFAITATPTGLLRLYNRFDLLAIQSTVSPAVRLIGVGLAALLDWPLEAYLGVYFAGGAAAGAVLVAMGWQQAYANGHLRGFAATPGDWFRIPADHPGLARFAIFSNLHVTVQTATGYLAPLLVGALAGPAATGLFKIARDVATAITRPAELLNASVYPEFARLAGQEKWAAFPRLILRGGGMAAGAGLLIVAFAVFAGPWFLALFFGADFVGAEACMVLHCVAATLSIAGFGFDPALYAMGRPGIPLQVNTAALALYLPALAILAPRFGATGAGVAGLIADSSVFIVMGVLTFRLVRRKIAAQHHASHQSAPAAAQ